MAAVPHPPPLSTVPTEDPRVTVVVATRNRREELLGTLARHRAPVVLVDNASTDGSAEAVRRAHPHVDVVELDENLGAAARTIGVVRARTPYVAFADDDSWWAPGALRTAADALADHPRLGLLNARIVVRAEERLDPVCAVMAASPLPPLRGVELPGPRLLGFVACAAMVRREAFLSVGGFDDVVRFPGEEERLAWDLTAAGWGLAYLDGAVVHHHPSPVREGPQERVRGLARSGLLTAVMRLPWPAVGARLGGALRGGPATRRGALDALLRARGALRRRAVLPPAVLADVDLLAGSPSPWEPRPPATVGAPRP